MGDHDNKIALVTGGAQGIGKGIVDVLSSEGAQVCIADISEEHGIKAVNEIEKLGRKAIYVQANFENSKEPKKVIEECVSRLGNISILVNNVGIQPSTSYKNIAEPSEEVWDAIINVNLKSYFLM